MVMASSSDPFDEVLELEGQFYQEGYQLGTKEGQEAGLIEGRLFGLEKGFEKYLQMGELNGRATVWAGQTVKTKQAEPPREGLVKVKDDVVKRSDPAQLNTSDEAISLSKTTRLTNQVRSLYALTEPVSLSTANNEEAVADFDDRLKRAQGKVKIVEKLVGESNITDSGMKSSHETSHGDGGIEDISSLHVRH